MGLLNWLRGGGEWRRWAQDIGRAGDRAVELASWDLAEQRKARADEELILTGTATELTQQWNVLDDRLQGLLESGFNERDLNELKREASERRVNALGATSFVRGRNVDRVCVQTSQGSQDGQAEFLQQGHRKDFPLRLSHQVRGAAGQPEQQQIGVVAGDFPAAHQDPAGTGQPGKRPALS